MATITGTSISDSVVNPTKTTLTASDTLTYNTAKRQILLLQNTTASPVVVTIDGNAGTTIAVPGYGTIDVSAGKQITVPANGQAAVQLSAISVYLQGTIAVTGGVGVTAMLFEL